MKTLTPEQVIDSMKDKAKHKIHDLLQKQLGLNEDAKEQIDKISETVDKLFEEKK